MRGLLITKVVKERILDGGEYINKRNKEILENCCKELDTIEISEKRYTNKLIKLKEILINKNFYGMTSADKKYIIATLKNKKYDFCFITSSLIGCLVKDLKKLYPDLKIIVFFHNVEYIYHKQFAKQKGRYNYILAFLSKYNEQLSVNWADKIVSLNKRDAEGILKIYKRNVDLIIPTSFKDLYKKKYIEKVYDNGKMKKLLFVGSNFYANFQGIEWFIKNVLKNLNNVELIIVGKGTEKWIQEFNGIKEVKIMGAVEDLKQYYEETDIVVLPIFLGSGMKTKTAEALMYGKYIFGTKEAFEGYEIDYNKVGGLCNTKEEFINNINNHLEAHNTKYNNYSRNMFQKKYNTERYISEFRNFLESMCNKN